MKLFKKKIFKYGAFAVALTCVTVAVVICVNVIFASLAAHFSWYADMTGEEYYDVSENAIKLLEAVEGENDVTIYFLAEKDMLSESATSRNTYGASSLWGMKYIHEIALDLADRFDYISVDYIDLDSEPKRVREIVGDEYYEETTFTNFNIIIDNLVPETFDENGAPVTYYHKYRVFTRDAFYAFNYYTLTVNAFRGDYRFASAISAITKIDPPTVYFVSGHAEAVGEYHYNEKDNIANENFGQAQSVWQFYRDCGYDIRKINLQYEDFEDGEAIVVIYAPQTDFLDGTVSEIKKLESFLAEPSHDLMLFMEPTSRKMPNLEGLIERYCDVQFEQAKIKAGAESAVSVDGYVFAADFAENDKANNIIGAVGIDGKCVFSNARPMIAGEGASTSVMFNVPADCTLIYSDDRTEQTKVSEKALLTLTELENENMILCSGSTGFISGEVMDSDVYINRDFMFSCLTEGGASKLPFNIPFEVIQNEGLDITLKEARVWTTIVSIIIPLAVAAAGVTVYVRRRHS